MTQHLPRPGTSQGTGSRRDAQVWKLQDPRQVGQLSRSLGSVLGLVLFGVALWIIYREMERYGAHQMLLDLRSIPLKSLVRSILLTPLCYLLLGSYDILGFLYLRRK